MPIPDEIIVLAGGLGTRLRGVVDDVPKPLAPVAGRPFLHWLLEGFARQGLARAVLATGFRAEAIRASLGESFAGLEIVHAPEQEPLGTGGAILKALSLCRGERVFAANGDSWIGVDLARLAAAAPEADLVLAVRPVADRARYGSVRVEGDSLIGMEEKGGEGPGLVNAGVYLLRRDLAARRAMPASFSFKRELLAAPGGLDVRVFATEAPFIDIGTPEDFAAAQALLPGWLAAAG